MLANSKRALYISLARSKRNGESECNSDKGRAMRTYFFRPAFAAFKSASWLALTV